MWFNGIEAHNKESMSVQHTEMNTKRLQWTWYSSLCVTHSWTPCYAPLPHKIALSVIKPCYCFVTELNEILLNCSKSQTQRRGNRNNALCDFLCIWYMEVQGNLNIRYHMNSLETRVTLCIINCPGYIWQFEMIKSSKLQKVLLSPYDRVLHLDISMVCMISFTWIQNKLSFVLDNMIHKISTNVWKIIMTETKQSHLSAMRLIWVRSHTNIPGMISYQLYFPEWFGHSLISKSFVFRY